MVEESVKTLLADFSKITSKWYVKDIGLFLEGTEFELSAILKEAGDYQRLVDTIDSKIESMDGGEKYKVFTGDRKKASAYAFYNFLQNLVNFKRPDPYEYGGGKISPEPTIVTPDMFGDILKLLPATFMGARDGAIFSTMFDRGIGVGEIVAIEYDDITQIDRWIEGIKFYRGENMPVYVKITNRITDYLLKYKDLFNEYLSKNEKKWDPLDSKGIPYFRNQRGNPIYVSSVNRILRNYANKLGLKGVNPTSLKYGCVNMQMSAGVEAATLSKWMGVRQERVEDIYSNVSSAKKSENTNL